MKLLSEFKRTGVFWLPSNPEDYIHAELSISDVGQIRLNMSRFIDPLELASEDTRPFGYPPMHEGDTREIGRILGIVGNKPLTLQGCFYSYYNAILTGGIAVSHIRADYAFMGVHFETDEEIEFSRIELVIDGLEEWHGISGFRYDSKFDDDDIQVKFQSPESETIHLSDTVKLKLSFTRQGPDRFNPIEARIRQRALLTLFTDELSKLEYFLDLISRLVDFFRFVIDTPVLLSSVTGYSKSKTMEQGKLGRNEIPIDIYYSSKPFADPNYEIRPPDILFRYKEMQSQFANIIQGWFENYEVMEPAFVLYFATKSNLKTYLEYRFLSLTQAIEILHRNLSPGTQIPIAKYEEFKDWVANVPDTEIRNFIEPKLPFLNEPTLRKRLTELVRTVERLFGNRETRVAFIQKVVATRNYLTHHSENLKEHAAQKEELWQLFQKLEALIQLHFLRLIGLDHEAIETIVDETNTLKQKLKPG